ncbi:MAG: tRNA pseudouridine(55) synthase TruB, partial [Candidatus Omnitrophica bacterium]|nr:tRNA pseudouridine(55) synthase TruB [Candidatus Omnitrophota bacterium]
MDGILVINKPPGFTSHDVVNVIRRKFNIKRVGHTGTLDPMATGVLVILMGKATKLSSTLICDDKEYIATLFLGKSTDTQDSTGKVVEEKYVNDLDVESVKEALNSFVGELEQIPPLVSAKKYKGKPLYYFARKGKSVPRKPCKIKIHEIELVEFNKPEITFRIRCSKGTYVRTLCEDIGRSIGYPAHMSMLVRIKSGKFSLKEAHNLHT